MKKSISSSPQKDMGWFPIVQATLLVLISLSLLFLAASSRGLLFPIVSIDYTASLSHWMNALTSPGLSAFQNQFANYAPLYLYFLKILTLLPFSYLYSIKGLTLLFDVLLSVIAVLIVKQRKPEYDIPMSFLVGVVLFSIPTVILNGAAWAQVDAAYTAFILGSLYFILRDKPLAATVAFAIAFCFKLQALFFLPVLIGYLWAKEEKIGYVFLIPLIFGLSLVPALLGGGSFKTWSTIYLKQVDESPLLTRSAPSVFAFMDPDDLSPQDHPVAPKVGMAAAVIVAIAIILLMSRYNQYNDKSIVVGLALLSVIGIPFSLPYMHERYFYIADVLSVILVFFRPKLLIVPILVIASSFYSYLPFLSATMPQIGKYIVKQSYLGGLMLLALAITSIYVGLKLYKSRPNPITA